MFSSKVSSAIRNFSTSALRKHGAHDYGGVPYKVSIYSDIILLQSDSSVPKKIGWN